MDNLQTISSDLVQSINEKEKKKPIPYDTYAKVIRIDGGTAWVHIPGGVDETPVAMTVNANVGDSVLVRVSGGNAWIVGNSSAPPTDDTKAVEAKGVADVAQVKAASAQEIAEGVEGIAVDAKKTAAEADSKAEAAFSQVGASITTDTLHYLATSAGSGVTINTPGWTTTFQNIDSTNRYLWTYHTYHKASGQSINTQPVITGVYGQQGPAGSDGDDGVSVTAVQPEYYLSTSASSATGGTWSTSLTYERGKYIWTREHITYSDSSTGYSSEIYNEALTGACSTAEQALNIAEGVNEHFWHDNTGAHVTQVTQEDWNDSQSAGYHSGGNTLITSGGIAIRDGLTELATFGASGSQIGQVANGKARTEIGSAGMQIIQNVSGTDTQIANLGYASGRNPDGTIEEKPFFTFGKRKTGEPYNDAPEEAYYYGDVAEYNGVQYFCIATTSGAWDSTKWVPAIGNYSVAEGFNTVAAGAYSHSENGWALGYQSHAESGVAVGERSHTDCGASVAQGDYSHATGEDTAARGRASFAAGLKTEALGDNQVVIGKYNYMTDANKNNFAFVIGNGTYDPWIPSNALTVDWSGNIDMAGLLQSFFNIVDLKVAVGQVAAHAQNNIGTVTVPTADRPDGMTLVGIVGVACNNYRVVPYNYYVNGAHSITCAVVNTTTAQSAAGTTITFKLLYAKMTSA